MPMIRISETAFLKVNETKGKLQQKFNEKNWTTAEAVDKIFEFVNWDYFKNIVEEK